MKRFYTEATAKDGAILLDGKPMNSPAKRPLIVPNDALAKAIADEWQAQGEQLDKAALPLTGIASLALDIAQPRREELIEELLEYGETDLLFYRNADEPTLETAQTQQWDPWLQRAEVDFSTHYHLTAAIMPIAQPAENRQKHAAMLAPLTHWQLAILAAAVKPTTSLLLSWYFLHQQLDAASLFEISQLEETHNAQKWGQDEMAKQTLIALKSDLNTIQTFRDLIHS